MWKMGELRIDKIRGHSMVVGRLDTLETCILNCMASLLKRVRLLMLLMHQRDRFLRVLRVYLCQMKNLVNTRCFSSFRLHR